MTARRGDDELVDGRAALASMVALYKAPPAAHPAPARNVDRDEPLPWDDDEDGEA
ncbi:hypothetical protein [Luteimonas changyuni]|uniref:hypothetical protein n=1 Tax=Luteimonas sp. MJ145 TaxID=3129234 RepID=UPI0031BB954E